MSETIKYASIDDDSLEFLKAAYFGVETNPYIAAANRAYLDLNRTIRFNGLPDEKRKKLRDDICSLLETNIIWLNDNSPHKQCQYDKWHYQACQQIQNKYKKAGIPFFIGQSQKWLNMTMKYLYILGACNFDGYFNLLHIPLDNYIFDISYRELGITRPKKAWSRMENYETEYLPYEEELRKAIGETAALRWEFNAWINCRK